MRIVINCRSILLSRRTGIGRYTYHLLDQLSTLETKHEYFLYARINLWDVKRKLPQFSSERFTNALDRWKRRMPEGHLYHVPSPGPMEPFEGKLVVTVHDMIYKTFPQSHTPQTVEMTQKYMEEVIYRADRIICTSENTRQDLHATFPVPHDRTTVVLNGVDHDVFYPLGDAQVKQALLSKLGISGDFLLFVGTLEPRKNLMGLLEAMTMAKSNLPLVVVGMKGWMSEDVAGKVERLGLKDRVIFTGFISDADLNILYNACKIFVFPSLYEGFGFPIVEAFSAGACVICSSTTSCGEIAGDAAMLINPQDPSSIANAIDYLMENPLLLEAYQRKAQKRSGQFTFTRTAQSTLRVYESL